MKVYKATSLYTETWDYVQVNPLTDHGAYDVVMASDFVLLQAQLEEATDLIRELRSGIVRHGNDLCKAADDYLCRIEEASDE